MRYHCGIIRSYLVHPPKYHQRKQKQKYDTSPSIPRSFVVSNSHHFSAYPPGALSQLMPEYQGLWKESRLNVALHDSMCKGMKSLIKTKIRMSNLTEPATFGSFFSDATRSLSKCHCFPDLFLILAPRQQNQAPSLPFPFLTSHSRQSKPCRPLPSAQSPPILLSPDNSDFITP